MMGGGGSMASMNATIKNNRKLLIDRKTRIKNVKDYFTNTKVKKREAIVDKQISKEEQELVNTKIRAEAKRRKKRYLTFKIVMILFFISILIMAMSI